jgi:hypothetical protein
VVYKATNGLLKALATRNLVWSFPSYIKPAFLSRPTWYSKDMASLKRVQVSPQNPQQLGFCRSQGQAILSAPFQRIHPRQAYRNTPNWLRRTFRYVESSWNVMAHGDAREGKWRGNWRVQLVASTLHTTSELGVCSLTTADAHTSAASSRWIDAPADLNGLVRFAERRNLVSARVPSHSKRSLLKCTPFLEFWALGGRGFPAIHQSPAR